MAPAVDKLLLNMQEACAVLRIGRSTLSNYALAKPARIKSIKIGNKRLFPVEEIHAFIGREVERAHGQ
jgi:excisionase family DNA binding protein